MTTSGRLKHKWNFYHEEASQKSKKCSICGCVWLTTKWGGRNRWFTADNQALDANPSCTPSLYYLVDKVKKKRKKG